MQQQVDDAEQRLKVALSSGQPGDVVRAITATRVPPLRAMLRARSLGNKGKKVELQVRLISHQLGGETHIPAELLDGVRQLERKRKDGKPAANAPPQAQKAPAQFHVQAGGQQPPQLQQLQQQQQQVAMQLQQQQQQQQQALQLQQAQQMLLRQQQMQQAQLAYQQQYGIDPQQYMVYAAQHQPPQMYAHQQQQQLQQRPIAMQQGQAQQAQQLQQRALYVQQHQQQQYAYALHMQQQQQQQQALMQQQQQHHTGAIDAFMRGKPTTQ
jgi:hypothetical protein